MEKVNLNWSELPFGYMKTACHVEYYFKDGKWGEAQIVEDDHISINIASTGLHYGQECFEGLKVFEDKDGNALMFRGDANARRMIHSATKTLMQPVPEEIFLEAVHTVVRLNKKYIPPHGSGASLYIRPLLIGTSGMIGVKPSKEYVFLVFCSPVGPYFKEGLKPIRLIVEEEIDRAAPNGVGDAKVGGNYAAGLRASKKAHDLGFNEVLYLDAKHKTYIDESGPANFFAIINNTYVTPDSGSILKSITNNSLMAIARDLGLKVEQRPVDVKEISTFDEAGCCGTAAVIAPVESITHRNETIVISKDHSIGPVSQKLYNMLTGIQSGVVEDKHGWTKKIPLD